jgi:hypothetical protein
MVKKFVSEQPDLRALYTEPTYAELKVALERYLDPSAGSAPVEKTAPVEEKTSVVAQKSVEKVSNTSVKDMIDEFDEVFN